MCRFKRGKSWSRRIVGMLISAAEGVLSSDAMPNWLSLQDKKNCGGQVECEPQIQKDGCVTASFPLGR